MDLFLDNTYQSLYTELLAKYTGLAQRKHINVLKLSTSLKLVADGAIKISTVPMLANLSGEAFSSALSITYYISELMLMKEVLIGKDKNEELEIISVFELCERKRPQDLVQHFNEHFLHNTFAARTTLTVADLLLFAFFNETVTGMTDKEKVQTPSLVRWFIHVQNLDGIKELLIDEKLKLVSLPPL